jgi:hypothetical protein
LLLRDAARERVDDDGITRVDEARRVVCHAGNRELARQLKPDDA